MTLDELIVFLRKANPDKIVQELSDELMKWKEDASTVEELRDRIERYIGNTWIEKEEIHSTVYKAWSDFVKDNIRNIGGMTMNERLWAFSLLDRFDQNPAEKEALYKKLLAKFETKYY